MEEQISFIPLLLVVFLAFLVPVILSRFKRLHLPIVVGEIIAGILIGRSGIKLVGQHDPLLDLLSEFGFVFLMFLSGLEIDFSNLGSLMGGGSSPKEKGLGPVPAGLLSFAITLLLSIGIGFTLFYFDLVRNPWMMALILSTTSLGVVVPVLKERGLSSGRYGQTLLIAALIADFATMLLITVEVAALSHGITLDILLVGLLFVAFFLIYHFGTIFFNRLPGVRPMMEELSSATAQIKMRASFTMMLIFVGLSEILGTEIILGAFLAGAIVALLRQPDDAEAIHQLEAVGFGFFIPIFFIMVGVNFDLQALVASSEALLLVPLLLLLATAVKVLPALLFRLNYSWRETLGAGALLSARLSLIIAASAIGMRLHVISEAVNSAVILVAIISVTLAPLIFIRLAPAKETEYLRPIVVLGAEELGVQVAAQLKAHHEKVLIIDDESARVQRARQHGLEAAQASLVNLDGQAAEYLDKARALVCTLSDPDISYQLCEKARSVYGIDHIVAQVNLPGDMERFKQLGVKTMNAAMDRAALLTLLARNPALYDLLLHTQDDKEVTEIVVHNEECVGRDLRHLHLPGDVLILALRRNGELLVPHGNTRIEPLDHLTLAGSQEHMNVACDMFGSSC